MTDLQERAFVHLCSMRHGEGEVVIAGKTWRWEFHDYLGPTFLKADWETPLVHQPNPKHPVWDRFGEWLVEYKAEKAARPAAQESNDG